MPIASGSLKPVNPKVIPVLLHVVFVFVFPMAVAPTLLPLAVQALLETMQLLDGIPICLLLSVAECFIVMGIYYFVVTWEGEFLHSQEQKILEIVASKAE
jgi:hypothetical protein